MRMKDELTIDGVEYVKKEVVDDDEDGEDGDEVEYVEIPDNVSLGRQGNILFNDRRQRLKVVDGEYGVQLARRHNAFVESTKNTYIWEDWSDRFCLVRCSREDLECGDTAFRRNYGDPCFKKLFFWCKILDKESQAHVSLGKNIIVKNVDWKFWWKVVRKDEVQKDD